MKDITKKRVWQVYSDCYKVIDSTFGRNHWSVKFVRNLKSADVIAKTKLKQIDNGYGGKWDYYDGDFDIRITKQHDLPLIVDEMMNLYSKFCSREKVKIDGFLRSVSVYKSKWVSQSRGCKVNINSGFIASVRISMGGVGADRPMFFFHGKSPEHVVKGLARKVSFKIHRESRMRVIKVANEKRARTRLRKFLGTVPKYLMVSYFKARSFGYCHTGVINFAHRYGLSITEKYPARFLLSKAPNNKDLLSLVIDMKRKFKEPSKFKKWWLNIFYGGYLNV